jgi:hypothetical protein
MLHRTWQQLEYHLDVLRATKRAHIEVYWDQYKTSRISLWSAVNHIWLTQFVCEPQFFKTPKGLCGHTVFTACNCYSPVSSTNKCRFLNRTIMHVLLTDIKRKSDDEPTTNSSRSCISKRNSPKYDELYYLSFGFTSVTINTEEQPQCFLCFSIVTCRTNSRQRPKYAHATMESVSQDEFSMRFAYILC